MLVQTVLLRIYTIQHVSNFTDRDSSVFDGNLLDSMHIFSCCAHQCMSLASGIFIRYHTVLEVGKPLKTCVLPIVCSPKATANIPKVSVVFFPSLRKIRCHFVETPQQQMEQCTLVLNMTSLSNEMCYSLLPNRK